MMTRARPTGATAWKASELTDKLDGTTRRKLRDGAYDCVREARLDRMRVRARKLTRKGQAMPADNSQLRTRASLLLRLRAEPDDQAAWQEFVARYGPLIYGWCRHWQMQPADAEDIAQSVLLKLAHHLRTFPYDPARRFRGLLRTLTHHAWSDFVEGWRRAVPGSGDSAIEGILDTVPARDDLAGRLEAGFDQELLDLASARVRQRVERAHLGGLPAHRPGRLLRRRGRRSARTAARHGLQGQEPGPADAA